MKEEIFNELLESIKQGGKILKGKRKASREFVAVVVGLKIVIQDSN